MATAFATTVTALYAAGRIDVTHEAAITQGALLAGLIDAKPLADQAPKWMTEYRQVWRVLMGDDPDDGPANSPAAQFIAGLVELQNGPTQ